MVRTLSSHYDVETELVDALDLGLPITRKRKYPVCRLRSKVSLLGLVLRLGLGRPTVEHTIQTPTQPTPINTVKFQSQVFTVYYSHRPYHRPRQSESTLRTGEREAVDLQALLQYRTPFANPAQKGQQESHLDIDAYKPEKGRNPEAQQQLRRAGEAENIPSIREDAP